MKEVKEKRAPLRMAGGEVWKDPTLNEWPENDFRIFVGNLGGEVSSDMLKKAFISTFPSVAMARVVRDKKTSKSKGFGFVSFIDYKECAKALRTMEGKFIGSRPVMLKTSKWKERNMGRGGRKKGGGKKRRR